MILREQRIKTVADWRIILSDFSANHDLSRHFTRAAKRSLNGACVRHTPNAAEFDAFCQALEENPARLVSLRLEHLHFSKTLASRLAQALVRAECALNPRQKHSALRNIYLTNAAFAAEALACLSDALAKHSSIEQIDLSYCDLKDADMPAVRLLVEAMNPHILELNLSRNSFSSKGMSAFIDSMKANFYIRKLVFAMNTPKHAHHIAQEISYLRHRNFRLWNASPHKDPRMAQDPLLNSTLIKSPPVHSRQLMQTLLNRIKDLPIATRSQVLFKLWENLPNNHNRNNIACLLDKTCRLMIPQHLLLGALNSNEIIEQKENMLTIHCP